jgi:hypothetical protein
LGLFLKVKDFGKDYEDLSYSLQFWEVDCPVRKQRILSIDEYSAKGNILNTKPGKSRLSDSLAKRLSKAVCK